jgi:hypothetical protein
MGLIAKVSLSWRFLLEPSTECPHRFYDIQRMELR